MLVCVCVMTGGRICKPREVRRVDGFKTRCEPGIDRLLSENMRASRDRDSFKTRCLAMALVAGALTSLAGFTGANDHSDLFIFSSLCKLLLYLSVLRALCSRANQIVGKESLFGLCFM